MKIFKILFGTVLTLGLIAGFAGCQIPETAEIKEDKMLTERSVVTIKI